MKIVIPYLESLGVQNSELSFETSFSLQIGTNKILVNGCDQTREAVGGRSDILIRRNNINLLILELKESEHELKDDDRDQAISYARLVHPIAPYVMVTNGKDWQLFDTLSKAKIPPEQLEIKDAYQLTLPETSATEAINLFLGYSVHNLLEFCHVQVKEQLKPLMGSPQELTKKYIPELTVPRSAFLQELAIFEASHSKGFLLLADSGLGKTSALCDYTRRRLDQGKPTIFFSGSTLEKGLLPAITNEFGWTFSEQMTSISLIRRLSEVNKTAPLMVVVDAIDEWSYSQRAQSLINLLRDSRNCYGVKFIFACRTAAWEGISQHRGSDIGFSEYLFCPKNAVDPKEAYRLESLSDYEFYQAVRGYRQVFKVNGRFEDKALKEAQQNPFMLRVMFAVAAESGETDITLSSRTFFNRYFELLLRKCGEFDQANAQLLGIAKLMFDRNQQTVSVEDVRSVLSLSVNESLLPALFEQNILDRRGNHYAFSFQHLRSYLVAFKILDWPSTQPAKLLEIERNGVRGEALAFYFRYATAEQLQAITDPIWKNAHQYHSLFTNLVKRYFSNLEQELVPGNGPEVGFVAEYSVEHNLLGGYGFRRKQSNEPAVLLVPVDKAFGHSNLVDISGTLSLHYFGSAKGFINVDIRNEVVEHELIERIKSIIKLRCLTLGGCEKLCAEAIISGVSRNPQLFSSFFEPQNNNLRFPITSRAVQGIILHEKLSSHFKYELIEKKRRDGKIKEHFSDGFVSYNPDISPEEENIISEKIKHVYEAQVLPTFRFLPTNIQSLEATLNRTDFFNKELSIEQLPWQTQFQLRQAIRSNREMGLGLVREHVRSIYEEFLGCYCSIIDYNFPILSKNFPLRSLMPVRLFIDLIPDVSQNEITGWLVTTYECLPKDAHNEVVMCFPGELRLNLVDGARYKGKHISGGYAISNLQQRMYSRRDMLLTDMLYSHITREWPAAANALRAEEGIPIESPNTDYPTIL